MEQFGLAIIAGKLRSSNLDSFTSGTISSRSSLFLKKDELSKKAFASNNMVKDFDKNYGKIYDQNGVMIINLHPLLEDYYQKLKDFFL